MTWFRCGSTSQVNADPNPSLQHLFSLMNPIKNNKIPCLGGNEMMRSDLI